MADLTSQLIVRLIDQVSGPANAAGRALRNLVSGATGRLDRALEANARALDAARGGMLDAAASAGMLYGALSRPIAKATEFQSTLLDIAQKADMSDASMRALGDSINRLSRELGQSSTELAKGVDNLIGRGLDAARAMEILPIMAKTSAAYRSTVDDVSKASFSVIDNLKVPTGELTKALDIMAAAGKAGAFELRDMAIEFPSLTASAANLGMTGTTAVARLSAALQIARKGAGTSSEAATNAANLMQKIISPETTKKFKEFGIDIRAELKKTQEAGGDVFEMVAQQILKATKGDTSKIGDIFQDAQVQKFLIPLIANLEEYRRIRDQALGADGVVEADFQRRVETAQAAFDRFNAAIERLQLSLGTALLPALTAVTDKLLPFADAMATFATQNPEIVSAITQIGAALLGLSVGLAVARYAFLLFQRGALLAIRGITVALGPVGWALAGIAAAGVWMYNNWQGLTELVGGFVSAIRDQFPSLGPVFDTLNGWIKAAVGFFNNLLGPVKMTKDEWRSLGETMGQSVAGFLNDVAAMPGKIAAFFAALPGQMAEIGRQIIQGLWDGMIAIWDSMMASISAKVQQLKDLFSFSLSAPSIRNSGGTPTPGMQRPNPLGDLINSQKKANGGRVSASGSYWVGEKGPEIFRPNVNGSITPNHAIGKGATYAPNINIVVNGARDTAALADEVMARLKTQTAADFRALQADAGLAFV